jgi:parvulin-like peptidyl-prolyl isomerase
VEKTLRHLIGPSPEPTAADVQAYYEAHLPDYMSTEEIRASHLYKKVDKSEERQATYDHLRQLRRQVLAGADFDALATEHTDKDDKLVDLGWFKPGDFMDEFGVIAFSLEEGEVSPVFASHFGFHLAKCTGRKPAVAMPLADVADEARVRLISESQQAASQAAVAKLKATATIEECQISREIAHLDA